MLGGRTTGIGFDLKPATPMKEADNLAALLRKYVARSNLARIAHAFLKRLSYNPGWMAIATVFEAAPPIETTRPTVPPTGAAAGTCSLIW